MSDAAAAAGTAGTPAETPTNEPSETASADGRKPGAGGPSNQTPANPFKGTKHKLVADGKELELEYDEVLRLASHGRAANERMRQAAEEKKQAVALREQAQTERALLEGVKSGNWRPLVELVGVDNARQFAEGFLTQWLEFQQMPEDKRARLIAEQERDAAKAQLTERQKKEQAEEQGRLEAKVGKELESEIVDALKGAGRSATPRLIMRIAEQQLANVHAELKGQDAQRLPAGEALKRAVSGIHQDIAEYLTGMPGDEILKVLPGPVQDVLRQAFADQVLRQDPFRGPAQQARTEEDAPTRRKGKKVEGTENFFKTLEKRYAR